MIKFITCTYGENIRLSFDWQKNTKKPIQAQRSNTSWRNVMLAKTDFFLLLLVFYLFFFNKDTLLLSLEILGGEI